MIIKFLVADERTALQNRGLGEGRWEPAVDHLIAGFDRIEYGGPIFIEEAVDPPTPPGADNLEETEALHELRCREFADFCTLVPDDYAGWRDSLDLRGRTEPLYSGDQSQIKAWWVKLFYRDDHSPVVIIHDARAFLCDDKGQTIEKLGPSMP